MSLLDRMFAKAYPIIIGTSEKKWLREARRDLLEDVRGDVLEIGAGTGLNLQHYGPAVSSLTLTERSPHMLEHLQEAVAKRRPAARVIQAAAESLPAEDDSADVIVSTLVLCSVGDVQKAFAEVRRVLRPGGRFVVLEHVAGTGKVARWQHRIEPFTKFFGRGCHVTRDTRGALERGGFDTGDIKDYWSEHEPKIYAPHILGTARPR